MEIKIESLIPYENIKKSPDAVFKLVEKNNTVVILKNNQPAYLIIKYEAGAEKVEKNIVMSADGSAAEAPVIKKRGRKPKSEAAKPNRQAKAPKKSADKTPRLKLHDAIKIVLDETDSKEMSAAELAETLYQRGLYTKRDGSKAPANQLRARISNYSEMFEALPGNVIKLKESDQSLEK